MSKETYFQKMTPHANRASQSLGIPVPVILAQWGLETGFGTSAAAKNLNNHAGIKSNSQGADYNGGTYAGYHSLNSFVSDYIRVMNLSYYNKVRQVGKTGNIANTVKALDDSPWAEDKQYYSKIMNIITGVAPNTGQLAYKPSTGSTDLLGDIKSQLDNLGSSEIKQMAMIGIGVVIMSKVLLD